jgi:hypothetical protein
VGSAYDYFVRMIHLPFHLPLLFTVCLPCLLRKAVVEIVCNIGTCGGTTRTPSHKFFFLYSSLRSTNLVIAMAYQLCRGQSPVNSDLQLVVQYQGPPLSSQHSTQLLKIMHRTSNPQQQWTLSTPTICNYWDFALPAMHHPHLQLL